MQQELNSSASAQNAINQFLALGIIEKLPNCSQPTLVGNGVCNLELDIPECDFDGNDCATTTTSTSTSTITTCPDWSKVSNLNIGVILFWEVIIFTSEVKINILEKKNFKQCGSEGNFSNKYQIQIHPDYI